MSAKANDAKAAVKWALDLGCQVEMSRGHCRMTYRGRLVGTIASTPSDTRSLLNARSFIRRNMRQIEGTN